MIIARYYFKPLHRNMRFLFIYLLVTIIVSGCNVKSKHFTSTNGWFGVDIPPDWDEYDDGEEGTYAFFNSKNWTGNLRITPLKVSNSSGRDAAAESLESGIKKNRTAQRIKLGDLDAIYYKEEVEQDGKKMIMYYWHTGKKDMIFFCSFTLDKDMEYNKKNQNELELVQNILSTIKIN